MRHFILAAALTAWPCTVLAVAPSFNDEIRPILSDRCFACHGFDANTREGNLRLDTPEGAIGARDEGPAIVPGKPDASIVWKRIISDDPDEVMPPSDSHLILSDHEKDLIKRWIEGGAIYEKHWSFVPVKAPKVPAGEAHPLDALIAARIARHDLTFSPEADRRTLIRRLSFDLRGLPPSPGEVDAFLADESPDAWEKLVDRFLADPSYGERMAWPWLDAARYADTNGYQGDRERTMWPWRDWIIDAFNRNLPYDEFTTWQIAGDMLPDASFEQKLATGFLRNHAINGEGGRIPEENRIDYVMDMAETVGTAWMALTMNCCRCHDHKYDPISQKEYYGLFDFFNQTPVNGGGGDPQTPPVIAAPTLKQSQREAELVAKLASLQKRLDTLTQDLADSPAHAEIAASLKATRIELETLRKDIPKVMVMEDRKERREAFVLAVGSYQQPGEKVVAHTPAILPPLEVAGRPPNRLDLARWLTSREHPLTARATVNRLWQEYFGTGFVKTPEDLGVQGEIPKHQAALDWLAADFMDHGWDLKRLVRTIVTSRTYRQSSRVSRQLLEIDPENRLLARGPRFRLPAWMIRDQALAASGMLVRQVGGEPVFPWQPPGLWEEVTFGGGKKHYKPDSGEKLRRRSLYTFWRRISAPPMFFDNAKREMCEVGSTRTNSPLHALATLNDPLYAEAARALALQALAETEHFDPANALARAFERVLCRPPTAGEMKVLTSNHGISLKAFGDAPGTANAFLSVGGVAPQSDLPADELAALASVCLSILNTDEALNKE